MPGRIMLIGQLRRHILRSFLAMFYGYQQHTEISPGTRDGEAQVVYELRAVVYGVIWL